MAQWVGYMVSIKCEDDTAFQGEIQSATNVEITLAKAFCNGIPCPRNEVKIRADEILELKLIDKQSIPPQQSSTITIAKPIAKRAGRTQSTSDITPIGKPTFSYNKSKPIDIEGSSKFELNESNSYKNNGTPNNNGREKPKKWAKGWRDEECFGSLDDKINNDFDFEKNLALFNKKALWDELNSQQKPDVIKHVKNKKTGKYRHDENVIATTPTTYRQITVPKQDFCEYVTDDGLIIPSISRCLRKKLWDTADRVGLSWEKRIELFGRAATEISIQLIGGAHRLNPRNSHQCPIVVVLCGPHRQGSVGVNTARQLASHGIRTIVYTTSSDISIMKKELSLYTLTRNRVISSISDLPNCTDLIIIALGDDTDNPKHYPEIAEWTSKNRAPVLAIDPPSVGTPGFTPKFSLLPVLPLPNSQKNGKLYLCNLGFPLEIFSEVGIKYKSPFGSKFVIPLHPSEE